jgi:translocation and assembly module TamB
VSEAEDPVTPETTSPQKKRRWLRRIVTASVMLSLFVACFAVVFYFWASSASFQDSIRRRIIAEIENATGGRAEIGTFHWDLLHLRAEVDNLTIHGLEAADEAPYAQVKRLRLQVAILGLFTSGVSTHLILNEAEIIEPQFHLIVYPDGSTNQPHPQHPVTPNKPAMDTLFDAQIGKLWVEHGTAHIADQFFPLDLEARDANLLLSWLPGATAKDGRYRINASVGELAFAEFKQHPVPSRIDAEVLLGRDGVELSVLRLKALDRTLNVSGKLNGLNGTLAPEWKIDMRGQVDLRILAPYIGLTFTRSGVVNLNATASGKGAEFSSAGNLSSDAIHYQDPVVDASIRNFSAQFQSDPKQLLVSRIRARLAQGGELAGEFQYDNWLQTTPKPAEQRALLRDHKTWIKPTGTVRATLNGVSLDTILTMMAAPPYRHLGLDAIASGPASATWTGLGLDLAVGGQLTMVPSANPVAGELPVHGTVDATFHSEMGSVAVRTLDVHLPHSVLSGQGSLGVFPVDRASTLDLDLSSSDLTDFDGALRALNLKSGDLVGTAALPVNLKGQAEFHGRFSSNWLVPRIDGHLTATNVGILIPASAASSPASTSQAAASATHELDWDSIDLDGLYSPASVVVRHGLLKRGKTNLSIQGELDSADPAYHLDETAPDFDEHSTLSLRVNGEQMAIPEVLQMAGVDYPVTGTLNAKVNIEGPLDGLSGSANLDVSKATIYGEPIDHVQAAATATTGQVKITTLTAQQSPSGGRLTGNGSYDLKRHTFQISAQGSAVDLASLNSLANTGIAITGKAGFTVTGDGTVEDPHLQSRATFSNLTIAGEPASDLMVAAAVANHEVTYDLDSRQQAGDFAAHGVTHFDADYSTEASLKFAKFDVGALLKLLKVTGLNGQSDLEGTATVSGPLTHPEKLRGEAKLNEFAVAIEGVHLASKGPVHATLTDGIARLDPIEITGEDTDLKLGGTLAVSGNKQLDLIANGSVNLRLAESLDPDLVASGAATFQMEAHGPVSDPVLQGKVEFKNAALALGDFPNGLSQIKGTLEFMQNRLQVRTLTAMSGGGQLSVSGYVGFQRGLYADLTATGKDIRIRYPQGVSSLADATLRLQGPQNNLLLSGNVEVKRFAINSDLDLTSLATQTGVSAIAAPDAPSNHFRLDVHLTSAPQLNFQNAFAKLAGDVDLRIRGTLASPSMLGRISLTEGNTSISGTKYELQRGDINFSNPVRIQPNIDLEATARVEDYDITLGFHGTPDKFNISYRSEPPLPEADVVALLALGRTQSEQAVYTQTQQQAGDNPMTDALLGGALNATVSNRVQRLFGTGAVKIDPNFIGALGNSSARVTVVEQLGKNVIVTYASNVNTTTQQLIQAEVAVNRHVSLVVTQDESGIFSVVVKARRRFR